jgi:asparagine synthase (glutamine-hydrolysing)
MCGIAGIVDTRNPPTEELLERMIASVAYRGPDGAGKICFPQDGVGLGHRRLSILDLTDAGRQPMASADSRYWITYNGEVYNYLEIRRELESLGRTFHSDTDTEVLLAAYEQWGRECLRRFMGMYAFAIWDTATKTLFAARDRLGIKPFYYRHKGGSFTFASEIKSILAVLAEPSTVDRSLIDVYMDFGYVPGEETMHSGIQRLLPGHFLIWHEGRLQTSSYWDLRFDSQRDDGTDNHADGIRSLLEGSIKLHLRSDVPLGVFLSGGLDSSAVVSLLAPGASAGLKTFSVAYEFGLDYDETRYARQVSAEFHTDHHEVRVTPQQFVDFIPQYIWHMDEPVTEAAAISLYYVAKLARGHVTVGLSGEGSDELFAGYDFYQYNTAIEAGRRLFGGGAFRSLASAVRGIKGMAKLRKYLDLAAQPLERRYRGISSYEQSQKRKLYTTNLDELAGRGNSRCAEFIEDLFKKTRGLDALSRMLFFDTKTWLVDDLLTKADRMSMANSLELRVPFLDHRLVEYAATIPSKYKIRRGSSKFVLKKALKNALPAAILSRRKMGFPTPLEEMLRRDLYGYAHETLLSSKALGRGYFNETAVRHLLSEHREGKAKNHRAIWQLLVLEEWHQRFAY